MHGIRPHYFLLHRASRLVVFLIFWALLASVAVASDFLPSPVAEALRKAQISPDHVGIFVQDVASARPLVTYGAYRDMNPASTIKLVTTYSALELLGPAYTWSTEVYTDGPVEDGVLQGNLVIKGKGDPKLTLERLWRLLRDLRERGLREIRGDLVLDTSYYALEPIDPGAFDNEPLRAYNVGPDAMLVNFNVVRVRYVPKPEAGRVEITLDPSPDNLRVVNSVKLDGSGCGDWRARMPVTVSHEKTGAVVYFTGQFSAQCGERIQHLNLLRNGQYVYGVFKQLWTELGGKLSGTVRSGVASPNARLLESAVSPPLADVIRDINKYSNNVMARQLFLTIGAERLGPPATTAKSIQAVNQWMTEKGLYYAGFVLENGSGLSRIERITPERLGGILLAAFRSPVYPELASSLPIVAVDGTMRRRLKEQDVARNAHIKSGSLEGVSAIAGYVFDKQGRRMVVVCLINHPNAGQGRLVHDALLEWVYARDGP